MDSITKEKIADFICGDDLEKYPEYRSGSQLTKFFLDIGINAKHDGTTRRKWVIYVLNELTEELIQKVILRLASPRLYGGDREKIKKALKEMNILLEIEGFKIEINGVEPSIKKVLPNYKFEEQDIDIKIFQPPNFSRMGLEVGIDSLLEERWKEVQKCVEVEATLAATILMGSMLEGLLLGVFNKFPRIANSCENAPKAGGKVKKIWEWNLNEMIEVAHSLGMITFTAKKYNHTVREFRNLIHPYHQLSQGATTDITTCEISWKVVKITCDSIEKWIEKQIV